MSAEESKIKFAENSMIHPDPHTITFNADEVTIAADRVCLGFEDIPFTFETIKTLEFKDIKGNKTFTYVRKD